MKWAVRGALALVVLVVLAAGVLAWALPRLASSDGVRARIQAVARQSLGREVDYATLDFALLPPALEITSPVIAGEDGGEPLARAETVALRVELWPLLRRELQVSSLRMDGLAVHLVRTKQGFALPAPQPAGPKEDGSGVGGDAPPDAEPEEGGLGFGIERIALRDASLVIDDRSQRPAATWRFDGVSLDARGGEGDEPVVVSGSLASASGPTLQAEGEVLLDAELVGLGGATTGPFTIDATDARLAWGSELRKPAGTRGVVRGELVRDDAGALGVDELEIALRDAIARGQLRTRPKTRLRVAVDAIDLEGWDAIVPALGTLPVSGRVSASELAVSAGPPDVRGRLALDGVVVAPPDRQPFVLDGGVELQGDALRSQGLVLRAADQPVTLDARVSSLFERPRYEVSFETVDADVDALLGAFTGKTGRIEGPLDAKGTLRGVLGGAAFTDTLDGTFSFDVERGRIVGVSLLEVVLGSFGEKLAAAGRANAAPALERFTNETFDLLAGELRVENGQVLTRPITLRYADYSAELQGPLTLADLSLDLRGRLTWFEEVDRALARSLGAPSDYTPQRRTIELAAVRGTLGAPKVQLAGNSVAALVSAYARSVGADELRRRVEKELGPGGGAIVDAIGGLLGGGRRAPAEPAPDAPADPPPDAPPPAAEPPPDAPPPADPPAPDAPATGAEAVK